MSRSEQEQDSEMSWLPPPLVLPPDLESVSVKGDDEPESRELRESWIAIEPPTTEGTSSSDGLNEFRPTAPPPTRPPPLALPLHLPPSFHDSQFHTILRHQRLRPADNSGLKHHPTYPSRFLNLTNSFEFAGWGSITRLKLSSADCAEGERRMEGRRGERVLGQWTASALAGNAVFGSVFYALPAVVAVGGIYSPVSLFVATLILFLWRPIMEELASALPISGAPYTYILNVSTKTFALMAASLLLLDFASTAIVSAATAAAYLAGEVRGLPFPEWVGAMVVLVLFTLVSLSGMRESARIALAVLVLHLITMVMLIIASSIHWGQIGTAQLKSNWHQDRASHPSARSVAKQIYYGICLGMLGLTGFECTPSYISRIKPGKFPLVLRNLHIPAIILNTVMMLLVLAVIPLDVILSGANVLSILAQESAGRWLRTWIVVDAIIVLCGGVLTGILSACELLSQLAQHRVIPSLLLSPLPLFSLPPSLSLSPTPTPSLPSSPSTRAHHPTRAPYLAVLTFALFSSLLYASAGASLPLISQVFALVWLSVMALFPAAGVLMQFNRGRLRRGGGTGGTGRGGGTGAGRGGEGRTGLGVVAGAGVVGGYFAAYVIGIVLVFSMTQNKIHLLRWVYWIYDQHPALHRWRVTSGWGARLIGVMGSLRREPVCILVKTDEINNLFHMILYVRKNEETAYLKIVHFYEPEAGIPSELEANAKILDEAFPEITIDLILVPAPFTPPHLAALSHALRIPQSLMFMSCPGPGFVWEVADFGGRIISL
ncbi:amino acid permease-domain-containing protein [Crassisporium funariophilum]|nr:amino acid permease-domain-containing protein [Crassisporium funariophilum]